MALVANTSSWPLGLPERIVVLEGVLFSMEAHFVTVVLSLGPSAPPRCVCAPLPPSADHAFVSAAPARERRRLKRVNRILRARVS